MRLRHYFFIFIFAFLFFFYPGDSEYFHIFAYQRPLFLNAEVSSPLKIKPIPVVPKPNPLFLSSESAYVIDLLSFTPVYEKNIHKKLLPASTTKIITALVVLDIYKLDDIIKVKKVHDEGQVMGLIKDEKITVENLLYGLLIHSGNDAAYALADAYGYNSFMSLMNQKANALGMKNTHFNNPAGLDHPEQISSAYDLAIAARELLKNPFLHKVVGIKDITISDTEYKIFHSLSNVNKLLGDVQGIGGLKTGYTELAGENLVSFYTKNNHQFIIVILKSADRFQDTRNAIQWIQDNVVYTHI